jgi:hypothetical protein
LDPDERRLIIELAKRGFLPRGIDKEPVIVQALLEENMKQNAALNKQKSSEIAADSS